MGKSSVSQTEEIIGVLSCALQTVSAVVGVLVQRLKSMLLIDFYLVLSFMSKQRKCFLVKSSKTQIELISLVLSCTFERTNKFIGQVFSVSSPSQSLSLILCLKCI